jgi:hypothetical protein
MFSLLESAHEVMVTKVKDSKPHTCICAPSLIDLSCANFCYSQAKPSSDEHVLVKTCDSFIASENDELERENYAKGGIESIERQRSCATI